MKTKLTRITPTHGTFMTIVLACVLNYAQAQEPITLTFQNFRTPPNADYFYQGANAAGVTIPAYGANRIWDYSDLTKNNANSDSRSYVPASYPGFPNALRQFNNF